MNSDLPERPPAGHKRWRVTAQGDPFVPSGPWSGAQIVDVPESVPRDQVEQFAREACREKKVIFVSLEAVT